MRHLSVGSLCKGPSGRFVGCDVPRPRSLDNPLQHRYRGKCDPIFCPAAAGGRESRQIEPLDVTAIMEPLGEGIRPLAQQRGLYLRCEGPAGLGVDGDAVKIRRIAQNLILNAVKYTRQGGITVTWGDSAANDPKRWLLTIEDTGPGFHTDSGQPLAAALDPEQPPLSSP